MSPATVSVQSTRRPHSFFPCPLQIYRRCTGLTCHHRRNRGPQILTRSFLHSNRRKALNTPSVHSLRLCTPKYLHLTCLLQVSQSPELSLIIMRSGTSALVNCNWRRAYGRPTIRRTGFQDLDCACYLGKTGLSEVTTYVARL